MKGTLFISLRQLLRNPRRGVSIASGLALAVGLAVATLLYMSGSAAGLTAAALRPVVADFVAHRTTANVDVSAVANDYAAQRGVVAATPLVAADFTNLKTADGAISTPPGKLFATTATFVERFPFVATLEGRFADDGILISEASAARLKVRSGDTAQLTIDGAPRSLRVSGILDRAVIEPLFASGDPNFEGAFAVVPDIVVMPFALYTNGAAAAALPTSPGARLPVDAQVYIALDRSVLAGDPAKAQRQINGISQGLERRFTGQLKMTNNDDNALTHARRDVIGAKTMFLFLGLPGIAVAGFLAYAASQVFAEETRPEVGLFRARGASPRQTMAVATVTALFRGIGGTAIGFVAGALLAVNAVGTGEIAASDIAGALPIALAFGLVATLLGIVLPVVLSLRGEISSERRQVARRGARPFWQRYWLDLGAIALAGLFFAVTYLAGGFKPTTAEGQSISAAFYVFLGPLLLWLGLTLLGLRALARLMPRVALTGGRALRLGGFSAIAARDLGRRPQLAALITTLVALTVASAISLITFTTTYDHERTRDSQWVVGSDIRVTLSSAGGSSPAAIELALSQPGVTSVSGFMRDTNALIGSKKQTVYGIDVASFRTTAFLPDSFFANDDAARTLDGLAATPNGVLVSRDEVVGFNVQVGDPLFVRLTSTDATGFRDV